MASIRRLLPTLTGPLLVGTLLQSALLHSTLLAQAPTQPAPTSTLTVMPANVPPELRAAMAAQMAAAGNSSASITLAADGTANDKKKIDPKMLQRFAKLVFDRRPSTTMLAWAKPEPKPLDDDPKLALPEEPKAPEPPAGMVAAAPAAGPPQPAPGQPAPSQPAPGQPATTQPIASQPAPSQPTEVVSEAASEAIPAASAPADPAAPPPVRPTTSEPNTGAAQPAVAELAPTQPADTQPADPAAAGTPTEPAPALTPEEEAANKAAVEQYTKDKAAYDKALVEYKKDKAKIEAERSNRKFEIFTRNVTLGRWQQVGEFLEQFGEQAEKTLYPQLLQKLAVSPPPKNKSLVQFGEKNTFAPADVLEIIRIAPGEQGFDKKHCKSIPGLVGLALQRGHTLDEWIDLLRTEVAKPEAERCIDGMMAARLLSAQGQDAKLAEFLPSAAEATANNNREALNLLARSLMATHQEDKKTEMLEQAWKATLAALAAGEIEEEQKNEALRRAVALAPMVRDELGGSWIEESFVERPERGMEVIATIGSEASKGMVDRSYDPTARIENLRLLSGAVNALLNKTPELADSWSETLNLLASVWLREAQHSYQYSEASSRGPQTRRDSFGNVYWVDYGYGYRSTPVKPLDPGDLLELRPDGRWRELIEDGVRPKFDTTIAELFLKVNEEKLAFPYIEQLAPTDPEKANELAKEFLRVWIKNNDPNAERNRTNIYNFSYGFNNRASGIPLTRSKQERNLRDLASWIKKLRSVEGIELDTTLLVQAFTGSHSAAEVYRIEKLEEVFGTLEDLDAKTLASMAQTMRANLAMTWRIPALQQAAGTNRKQKDIEAEVQRGYALAQEMLGRALESHPDSWRLQVARAAMEHDLNNYRNEIKKASAFADTRRMALESFEDACDRYIATLPGLDTTDETVEAFEYWYHAALGASDIGAIDHETVLAQQEIGKIKAKLASIDGEVGERHLSKFANSLFTKLSSVNPAVKNRFLRTGFEIVGTDHPQAREAYKVFQFYKDLIQEIEVVAMVDGPSNVGTEPFGLRVDIEYTKEIERESGGFSKYLQNQANAVSTSYNYGRPPENYRDKFEKSLRTALEEGFEVKSITFNSDKVASKSTERYGWRRTPYAYVLLQAKGPEIDRVPPITMDLDFLDVTGYVVLPVSSAVVPLDASVAAEARPFDDLEITQILDERKAKDGELSIEIKARANGLIPNLDHLVNITPLDFVVEDTEDQGLSVSRFGDDEDSIISERLWVVKMRAKEGVDSPDEFRFADPLLADTTSLYQRYDDADLVTAEPKVKLLAKYADSGSLIWLWISIPVALMLLLAGWFAFFTNRRGTQMATDDRLELPARLTPFSVLGYLRELRESRVADAHKQELDSTIARIEQFYFGQSDGSEPDLTNIANEWRRRA